MNRKEELLLSAQRALLFNIIPKVKYIFIETVNTQLLMMVYSNKELTPEEKDMYFAVCGEIVGDFEYLSLEYSEVRFEFGIIQYDELKKLENLVFAQYSSPNTLPSK
jgi:hypothetical protein